MEVKINKDIREFTESIFFGLSMRQFIFSLLACIVAVILYFAFKPFFEIETLSWMCILGAAPFAVLGFVKYNGMTAEKFVMAWIKSQILSPKRLYFKSTNFYYEIYKEDIENLQLKDVKKPKKEKVIKDKKLKKKLKIGKEKIDENTNKNI